MDYLTILSVLDGTLRTAAPLVLAALAGLFAERSGVAKSTLYRHWSSVPELLIDVMRANVPPPVSIDLGAGFEAALRSSCNLTGQDHARLLLFQAARFPFVRDILHRSRSVGDQNPVGAVA